MMAVVDFLVFAAALSASLAVFGLTLVPAVPRIVSLLRNGVDPAFVPARVTFVSQPRPSARIVALPSASRPAWREAA